MSTEHQQYSPENQLEIIRQYAAAHNMEIVQEYSDHGRSGLNIAGREGLNQLMADVEAKRTTFTSLLVYDVSRWGRFQDVDESAYYEYVLKRSGIRVHYCAEQFENDGSMSSSVLKTLKRSMACGGSGTGRVYATVWSFEIRKVHPLPESVGHVRSSEGYQQARSGPIR
jgi:DNA invertase Pin-like site-specific DNA recombinase